MTSSKSKSILFLLGSQQYFRNYIETGALSKIRNCCEYLVNSNISGKQIEKLGQYKVARYDYPARKARLHEHLFNINTRKFINRSKTFKFRFLRISSLKTVYTILALPIIYSVTRAIILALTRDEKLSKLITKINPELILMPSSGYEGEAFEIIKIAKDKKIPTLMLVDNWDNLCSKTILTRKPDFMAVWGRQTKEHAMRIHSMKSNQVIILGTPRFIQYFSTNGKKPSSVYPFKYALFAGNALAFDELATLRVLDKLIDKHLLNLTIIYRPHPWRHPRKCADTFFEYDFKHVKLDEDAKNYYKRELGDSYAPDLNYYPRLLANMEFMICPLSTMLIEGLLFDKKVFVLAYDDGIHLTNPKNAFKYYEHFEGIGKLANVTIIDTFDSLVKITNHGTRKNNIRENERASLDYYIASDTANYQLNLQKITDKIMASWNYQK